MAKKKQDTDVRAELYLRAQIVYGAFIVVALCVIARLVWVMLPNTETAYNAERLESRIFFSDTIISRRGSILARDDEPLATSILRYRIDFDMGSEGFDDEDVFRENVDSLSKLLSAFFGDRSAADYRKRMMEERDEHLKWVYSHDSIVKRSSDLLTWIVDNLRDDAYHVIKVDTAVRDHRPVQILPRAVDFNEWQTLSKYPILNGNIIKSDFEAGVTSGRGNFAPMWHFNNRQGAFSADSEWAYARAAVEGKHIIKNRFGIEWGVDIIGGYNLTSNVFIQQAYADVQWRMLKLSVGQKERWNYIQNARLSTGALTESGNARPIPQVRFEMPDYWDIPWFNGWAAIRGHIAYGWFTDGHWQKEFTAEGKSHTDDVRYHSKAGFLRIGNEKKFPLTAEMGLHMVTQFGGTCYNRHHHPYKRSLYRTDESYSSC